MADDEWELVEPFLRHVGKRGRYHRADLRMVLNAIFYVTKSWCQWRMLLAVFGSGHSFGVGQRTAPGRGLPHGRGALSGGATFHDRGGRFGSVKGATRVVVVDVTGLPMAAPVVPASVHDNDTTEVVLEAAEWWGSTERLELLLRGP